MGRTIGIVAAVFVILSGTAWAGWDGWDGSQWDWPPKPNWPAALEQNNSPHIDVTIYVGGTTKNDLTSVLGQPDYYFIAENYETLRWVSSSGKKFRAEIVDMHRGDSVTVIENRISVTLVNGVVSVFSGY